MQRVWVTIATLTMFLAAVPAVAQTVGSGNKNCGDQPNTVAIVDCLAAETNVLDQRLNTAYKNLAQHVDAGQRDPLRVAQRLWIQYRDANCRFYGSREGSIREIQAAECLRVMTQNRSQELERAAQP